MADKTITTAAQQLFAEKDGSKFSLQKDKLIKNFAGKDRHAVINILIQYSREGALLHWRNFLLTDIIRLAAPGEKAYSSFFEWTLTVPELSYWGVEGLLKTSGREAYAQLVELAANPGTAIAVRANAIKRLSQYSRQLFDRELPSDPGYWKPEQLRMNELLAWQQAGYPDGTGYPSPQVHPSLLHPGTPFEKLIAKLDKQLEKSRRKNKDQANPRNWLVMADEKDMDKISAAWQLPAIYAQFLRQYSPLKVVVAGHGFIEGLHLYGATELLQRQEGYSFNAVTQQVLEDWPKHMLVIGDDGADPYCLDLSAVKDGDAPVYTSLHGQGRWEFELYADSFTAFIQRLTT